MIFYKETDFREGTIIGKVPTDWEIVRIEKVCALDRGFLYRSDQVTTHPSKIRFITINDFEKEGGLKRNSESLYLKDETDVDPKYFLDEDEVLVANTDMSRGFIIGAPIYIEKAEGKVAYSMDLTRLIFDKKTVNGKFLFYLLKHEKIRNKMKTFAQGTNVLHLNHELMKKLEIPLPPVEEQRAVAGVLGVVDSVIAKTDEVIAKTERLKKGLMQTLLTRGIGHKEFKETEIGKIPKTWQIVSLGDVCEQRSEIVQPSADNKEPFVGLEHIASGETRLRNFAQSIDVKSAKFRFYAGDILYGKLRPYLDKAVLADLNGICSTDLLVLKPKNNVIKEFLIYVLHSTDFIKHAIATTTGTNHPRTSWTAISKFKFGLPEHSEQQNIANILSTIDRKLELEKKEKVRLERIKRGLMDLLLTGKIRVKVY
jgi:type I restriction enzyme S subunit